MTVRLKDSVSRTILLLEYRGRALKGVNKQLNRTDTVQGVLDQALTILLNREVSTYFMSRTDTGVSAFIQLCEVRGVEANCLRKRIGLLNLYIRRISTDIRVKKLIDTTLASIKRISKTYLYKVALTDSILLTDTHYYIGHINVQILQQLLSYLSDREIDYSSFCSSLRDNTRPTCMKVHYRLQSINRYEFYIYIQSKFFLYKQIRNVLGTLLHLSMHEDENIIQRLKQIIDSKDRSAAYNCAPGYALTLYDFEIEYPVDKE